MNAINIPKKLHFLKYKRNFGSIIQMNSELIVECVTEYSWVQLQFVTDTFFKVKITSNIL